jgi:hypothetical protein
MDAQLRRLGAHLSVEFQFVVVQAPAVSSAGDAVVEALQRGGGTPLPVGRRKTGVAAFHDVLSFKAFASDLKRHF